MIALEEPACKGFKRHPYLPLPLQIPLDLQDHVAQVAELIVCKPESAAESSPVLAPTEPNSLLGHSVNGKE